MRIKSIFKSYLMLFFMIMLCAAGLAKDKQVNSQWVMAPMNIDGNPADWEGDTLTHEKKVKVNIAFRNDNNYLYTLFQFTDQQYISSLTMSGLIMYFNTQGKKKKDYGIRFLKKQITADEYIAILEAQKGPLGDADKEKIRANRSYIQHDIKLVDKKGNLTDPAVVEGKSSIFRAVQSKEAITFEFVVPLERAEATAAGIGSEAGNTIKVGFEWGGTTKEMKEAQLSRFGAQNVRARSGGMTSNPNQERGVSGQSAPLSSIRRRLPKKYDFWVDVKLAKVE